MTNAGYEIRKTEHYFTEKNGVYFEDVYGVAFGEHIADGVSSFVTWEFKSPRTIGAIAPKYSFFWGHYFSDRNAALADYHQRLADGYGRHVKESSDETD